MDTKVAIPCLNERVAPCFEAATQFIIVHVVRKRVKTTQKVNCDVGEGFKRIRLLKIYDIKILICNGIKDLYQNLLRASGFKVISGVSDSVDNVISRFLAGELVLTNSDVDVSIKAQEIPHEKLVSWTRELFENNGYTVKAGPGEDSFLVDLIAEIKCPVCKKTVRVAICCGAHTYRTEQEISEFYHFAKADYNARVFVYPENARIAEFCQEYGIEMISPDARAPREDKTDIDKIPILHRLVEGHEQASRYQGKK